MQGMVLTLTPLILDSFEGAALLYSFGQLLPQQYSKYIGENST